MSDLKEEDATLEKLAKTAGRLDAEYSNIIPQPDGLPKDPGAPPAAAARAPPHPTRCANPPVRLGQSTLIGRRTSVLRPRR